MNQIDFISDYMEKSLKITSKTKIRTVNWLIYLRIIPSDPSKLLDFTEELEQQSKSLFSSDKTVHSQIKTESQKKMKKLIELDVLRTHSGNYLFEDEVTKTNLTEILLNFYMFKGVYKQGMNEVLSVVYYACYLDFNNNSKTEDSFLDFLLVEANFKVIVYRIFLKLIDDFVIDFVIDPERRFEFNNEPIETEDQLEAIKASKINKIAIKCFYFHLKNYEKDVFEVLFANSIEPFVVIYRCIICLFSREMELTEVVSVWDSLLCSCFIEKQSKETLLESFLVALFTVKECELTDPENEHRLYEILMNEPIENAKFFIEEARKFKQSLNEFGQ